VGHASWLVQDRDALVQLGDWSWDDGLTGALGGLTHELFLDGRWESRATLESGGGSRLVEHEGEGSQAWPHDTHSWGLEVSRELTVHVTAKTNRARLQKLWGNNLNPGAIRHNLQALFWDNDGDNVVLKALNDGNGLALMVLLDELLANGWEPQLLTVDHNLQGARGSWDNLGLSDARQNLDNLLLRTDSPGGDSHWDVLGAVQKEDMLTVVDLVLNSLVVESGDKGWLNTAGRWHVLASHLDSSNLHRRVQPGGWEDELSVAHQAQVPQNNLPRWGLDLGSNKVGGAFSTSLNHDTALNTSGKLLALNITNEQGLGDTIQQSHEGGPGPGLWSLNDEVDLVEGGSLATDKGADWSKQQLAALLSHALLVLWGLADLLLQQLSLFQISVNLDVLHVGRLAKGELELKHALDWFLKDLLNAEPVLQFWQFHPALKSEAIRLARDAGNLKGSQVGALRLLAQNDNAVDLLQWRSGGGLGHANDLNNISLLELGKDSTNLGKLNWNVLLSDLHLGQRVHHALGGKPEDNVELLGLGPGWVVLNPEGGPPDRGWEDARWNDGKWSVLGDLLDVGVQVGEHGLRLVPQLGRKAKGLTDFHFNWLPLDSRGDLLQTSGVSDWGNLEEVVLESVWLDESVEALSLAARAHDLSWGPDGQLNLTTGDLALNFNWDGGVHGHVNTRADELLGEWSDNTRDGLDLAVQDWDKLGREPWGHVALNTRDLDGALDGIDDWQSRDRHNWETSLGDKHVGGLEDLGGTNLVELHLMSRQELLGELLKGFQNNLRVQVQG